MQAIISIPAAMTVVRTAPEMSHCNPAMQAVVYEISMTVDIAMFYTLITKSGHLVGS